MREGQDWLCKKFPASGGAKSPCFALAWGKSQCNFQPCKDKNEHDTPASAQVMDALKGYLQSKSLPATYSEWSAANPRT